ncbi:unannotated protein [freshwater metagenome]|uniref:Unannotated protein n=1 Tax=freshwater metagenome TaxID=449393 RepID=A0A6J6KAG2_9ZZZZ
MLSPSHVGHAMRLLMESIRSPCVNGPESRVTPIANNATVRMPINIHTGHDFNFFIRYLQIVASKDLLVLPKSPQLLNQVSAIGQNHLGQ